MRTPCYCLTSGYFLATFYKLIDVCTTNLYSALSVLLKPLYIYMCLLSNNQFWRVLSMNCNRRHVLHILIIINCYFDAEKFQPQPCLFENNNMSPIKNITFHCMTTFRVRIVAKRYYIISSNARANKASIHKRNKS